MAANYQSEQQPPAVVTPMNESMVKEIFRIQTYKYCNQIMENNRCSEEHHSDFRNLVIFIQKRRIIKFLKALNFERKLESIDLRGPIL